MLVVVASRFDKSAPAFAERRHDVDARLLTCRDLSRCGWRYYPGDSRRSRAVIGDEIVPFEEIDGAVICTPCVNQNELLHIEECDRSYVAAEMTAFLAAWLSEARFPVINRPNPACLMGPNWPRTRWIREAAMAGMRTSEVSRAYLQSRNSSDGGSEDSIVQIAVIGKECLATDRDAGIVAAELQAKRLAAAARVTALTVVFRRVDDDLEFLRCYPGVDIGRDDIADALLDCLFATVR